MDEYSLGEDPTFLRCGEMRDTPPAGASMVSYESKMLGERLWAENSSFRGPVAGPSGGIMNTDREQNPGREGREGREGGMDRERREGQHGGSGREGHGQQSPGRQGQQGGREGQSPQNPSRPGQKDDYDEERQ